MAGAIGALLLQAGFLFLFLTSMPHIQRPVETVREMTLLFRRAIPQLPHPPAPQPEAPILTPAPSAPLPSFAPPPAIGIPPALPDLRGFGEMLNDCTPQNYVRLAPEKQVRCPHPSEGWTAQDGTEIDIAPRSHAKDLALWQEDSDEKHWSAGMCDPAMGLVALCQMHQAIAEHERAEDVRWHLARAKADALKPPPPSLPDSARASKN